MLWRMQTPDFDCLVPDWPAPPQVRALCSTRAGGLSSGRYASLNLGTHVGDAPQAVDANRKRLKATLGAHAVFLEQVHGTAVLELDATTTDGMQADAATTTLLGLACTVMVADCLPVLFCDANGSRVAAAHAGWRGLLGVHRRGILETTVESFGALGAGAGELMVWLGPCIGPDAFEVGDEVRSAFVAASPLAAQCFRPTAPGKWLADLPGLARQRLQALGIARTFGNDGSAAWCTVTQASRFFSHRRDAVSGRMAACIWRVG
jgi:YfiH family protein